jgi:dTDP-4-dehydrorhamnose 3,5-epimerase
MIAGVVITSLKIFSIAEGNVMHAMKSTDSEFRGFGEAYFSMIAKDAIKAWNCHKKMTINLIVPVGSVRFKLFDDRNGSLTYGANQEVILSQDNYCRLTIPPMVWVGFQGMDEKDSVILNIANIPHDPREMIKKKINEIEIDWEVK